VSSVCVKMDIKKNVTVGDIAFACHWAGCGRTYSVKRCLKRHQRKAGHVRDGCGTSNSGEKSGAENQRKCRKVESVTLTITRRWTYGFRKWRQWATPTLCCSTKDKAKNLYITNRRLVHRRLRFVLADRDTAAINVRLR
jgi:hypothetical protein